MGGAIRGRTNAAESCTSISRRAGLSYVRQNFGEGGASLKVLNLPTIEGGFAVPAQMNWASTPIGSPTCATTAALHAVKEETGRPSVQADSCVTQLHHLIPRRFAITFRAQLPLGVVLIECNMIDVCLRCVWRLRNRISRDRGASMIGAHPRRRPDASASAKPL